MSEVPWIAVCAAVVIGFVYFMRNSERMNREREQVGLPPMNSRVMTVATIAVVVVIVGALVLAVV